MSTVTDLSGLGQIDGIHPEHAGKNVRDRVDNPLPYRRSTSGRKEAGRPKCGEAPKTPHPIRRIHEEVLESVCVSDKVALQFKWQYPVGSEKYSPSHLSYQFFLR